MTNKELKKLGRKELLEMLIDQGSEMERLKDDLEAAKEAAQSKEITVQETGSLAEASLTLNGVFESAQAAAEMYLENIKKCDAECEAKQQAAEQQAAEVIAAAEQQAAEILAAAERQAAETLAAADQSAGKIVAEAKKGGEEYWNLISQRLERFYEEHAGLKAILQIEQEK